MTKSKKSKIEQVHIDEAKKLKAIFKSATELSQADFGAEFEIGSQGMVWQYLNAASPLNLEAAIKFARGLNCEVSDFSARLAALLLPSSDTQKALIGAEFPPSEKGEKMPKLATVSRLNVRDDQETIPQYETGGAMGSGLALPDQPGVIYGWQVNREWLTKNAGANTGVKNLCIVTGFGDSMRPMFNPGDPLMVDTGVKTVEADGIYFFRIGNDGFIKRLQRIPGDTGMVLWAISQNKDYKDFPITDKMDFEVLGKVIRVWCGTDF